MLHSGPWSFVLVVVGVLGVVLATRAPLVCQMHERDAHIQRRGVSCGSAVSQMLLGFQHLQCVGGGPSGKHDWLWWVPRVCRFFFADEWQTMEFDLQWNMRLG